MKYLNVLAVGALAMILGSSAAAQDKELPSKGELKTQIVEALPKLGAEKVEDRRDAQQKLQKLCFELGKPGNETQRAAACEVIVEVLGEKMAGPARVWLIRQLRLIGREESVDAVAKALDDSDRHVRDAACRALADMPVAAANAKLLAKMSSTAGPSRVDLINAIGFRGDSASVRALVPLLHDRDSATAAANALGKIGGAKAAGALRIALKAAPDALKSPIADAYLRCADKLLAQGKKKEAVAIYEELSAASAPKAIQLAAEQGKLKAAAKK